MFSFKISIRLNTSLKVAIYLEAVTRICSIKNVCLKIPLLECLFNKVTGWKLVTLFKNALLHMYFFESFVKLDHLF